MKIILKSDQLIDGTGANPVIKASILIENDRIMKISPSDELTSEDIKDAEVIDHKNGTILPGFIEMHSHIHCSAQTDAYESITTESNETFILRGSKAVRDALISGVTTMRDLGSKNEVIFPIFPLFIFLPLILVIGIIPPAVEVAKASFELINSSDPIVFSLIGMSNSEANLIAVCLVIPSNTPNFGVLSPFSSAEKILNPGPSRTLFSSSIKTAV